MKILTSLAIITILILSGSQAFGQQLSMGTAPDERIVIIIDGIGTAHVTHSVKGPSSSPVQVNMINGNLTNFTVTDVHGDAVEYGEMQTSPKSIILNTSQRNMTLIKYDLPNIVSNTDGVWKWNYLEPQNIDFTEFHFPKGVDMIWANDRPVYLGEHGLAQHGNGFTLVYVINEPININDVKLGEKNFAVGVRTVSGVGNFAFDQSLKTYSFSVDKAKVPITVLIPQDLSSGPYDVKLNGNGTLHQEFYKNGTHSWIGLLPAKSGTIQVIATSVSSEQGVSTTEEPQPGSSTSSTTNNNMIIPVVIGIIVVAGVIGFFIIKKRSVK